MLRLALLVNSFGLILLDSNFKSCLVRFLNVDDEKWVNIIASRIGYCKCGSVVFFFFFMFSLVLILFYDILMARVCFRVGWMLVLVYY